MLDFRDDDASSFLEENLIVPMRIHDSQRFGKPVMLSRH